MRPYWAVIRDSFRETLRSPVLWVVLALVTLGLAAVAPLSFRQVMTTRISEQEVSDWDALAQRIAEQGRAAAPSPGKRIWESFDAELREQVANLKLPEARNPDSMGKYLATRREFQAGLNRALERSDLYDAEAWQGVDLGREGNQFLRENRADLPPEELGRFNRLLVEQAYADLIEPSPATSLVMTYGWWDINADAPLPFRQQQLHRVVQQVINTLTKWIIGGAGILAAILVTSPIIPRMFDTGQLHLLLSKPISRSLLLTSQYLGGCAYILVIVSYLVVGLWLILGLRFNLWDARMLWLIPMQVFAFAVYFAVSMAAGVVYRGALMSIIAAMLFWALCFSLGTSKLFLENNFINRNRFHSIVPVGEDMLAVNEQNYVHTWNATTRSWDEVFLSEQQVEFRMFTYLMPMMPPMIGPVYDANKQEIYAIQRPFGPAASVTLGVGRAADDWDYHAGVAPPMGTFAMFREPAGSVLLAGNLGVFRLQGDPLAEQRPVKVLGFEVPLPTSGPFRRVTPEGLVLGPKSAAALDPQTGDLLLYTRGQLTRLARDAQGQFQIAVKRDLDVEDRESLALGLAGGRVVIARKDGRLQVLDATSLHELSTTSPEPGGTPRFVVAAADGAHFAVLFHQGTLWMYDAQQDAWSRPPVAGQGNISAVAWRRSGELLVADRGTRVSVYEEAGGRSRERLSPRLSWIEIAYHYGVWPLYTIFPKPGEMDRTFEYLVSGDTTTSATERGSDEISSARRELNPWAPVWSGLLFIGVVLIGTCIYFERQEY
jgi:hypothetical protein